MPYKPRFYYVKVGVRGSTLHGLVFMMLVCISPDRNPNTCFFARDDGLFEPRHEKTCLRGCRSSPTQAGMYNHRWLDV